MKAGNIFIDYHLQQKGAACLIAAAETGLSVKYPFSALTAPPLKASGSAGKIFLCTAAGTARVTPQIFGLAYRFCTQSFASAPSAHARKKASDISDALKLDAATT